MNKDKQALYPKVEGLVYAVLTANGHLTVLPYSYSARCRCYGFFAVVDADIGNVDRS
jgi:hypothetical protein